MNLADAAALAVAWGMPTVEAEFSAPGIEYLAYRKAVNHVAVEAGPLCWYAEVSVDGPVIRAAIRTESDDPLDELRRRIGRAARRRRVNLTRLELTDPEAVQEWFLDWVREGRWLTKKELKYRLQLRAALNGAQIVHGSRTFWLDPSGAPTTMKKSIRRADRRLQLLRAR